MTCRNSNQLLLYAQKKPDIERQFQLVFAEVTCRWTLDDFLGAGAFGQSYLATHEPTGHRYVMKFLSRDNDRELKFLKEAAG